MKTTARGPKRRSIPATLAPVLEELELRQPKVVTKKLLAEILASEHIGLDVSDVANRLQKHGWLLSLKTRGIWEFAPAARAGAIDSGDQFIELRATLIRRPGLKVAVAYESAAWLHGLAHRPPVRDVVAVPRGIAPPPALLEFRVTRNVGTLDPVSLDGLPVWRTETLLVLMAAYPTAFRAWPTVSEWLHEAAERTDWKLIERELAERRPATWVRTGYLMEIAGQTEVADRISIDSRFKGHGPYYFGLRKKPGKHSKRWDIIDSLLLPHWTGPSPFHQTMAASPNVQNDH